MKTLGTETHSGVLGYHQNEINNYDEWFICHGVGHLPEDEWEDVAGGRLGIDSKDPSISKR